MKWSLYIDDERMPKTAANWKIARNGNEAFSLIKKYGFPEHISFDHDLGCDSYGTLLPTAYDFAKALGEKILDGELVVPDNFTFNVHSANPLGAANIQSYMTNLLSHIEKKS
jgi:hypothetical protein